MSKKIGGVTIIKVPVLVEATITDGALTLDAARIFTGDGTPDLAIDKSSTLFGELKTLLTSVGATEAAEMSADSGHIVAVNLGKDAAGCDCPECTATRGRMN